MRGFYEEKMMLALERLLAVGVASFYARVRCSYTPCMPNVVLGKCDFWRVDVAWTYCGIRPATECAVMLPLLSQLVN